MIIHIAGLDIQVGSKLVQRCAWCGALLVNYDLERIAVPVGQDPRPATWEIGRLVAIDGAVSCTVAHTDGDSLPEGTCAVSLGVEP